MLLWKFIRRWSAQYNLNTFITDLSVQQIREALKAALSDWAANVSARPNRTGQLIIKQGSREAITPVDYLSTSYDRLYGAWKSISNNLSSGEIVTSTSSLISSSYFSSGSAFATNFPPGYDASFPECEVPTTTSDRGRVAIDLGGLASSNALVDIIYDGIHQIEDAGKLITINELPESGDEITINGKEYTFGDDEDEIEIADDTYSMAETLADQFELDQDDTKVEAMPNGNSIILRPAELGSKIILALDEDKLISTKLPALSTVEAKDERIIFRLMMFYICETKERQSVELENYEAAKAYAKQKESHDKFVKPYLHVGR